MLTHALNVHGERRGALTIRSWASTHTHTSVCAMYVLVAKHVFSSSNMIYIYVNLRKSFFLFSSKFALHFSFIFLFYFCHLFFIHFFHSFTICPAFLCSVCFLFSSFKTFDCLDFTLIHFYVIIIVTHTHKHKHKTQSHHQYILCVWFYAFKWKLWPCNTKRKCANDGEKELKVEGIRENWETLNWTAMDRFHMYSCTRWHIS